MEYIEMNFNSEGNSKQNNKIEILNKLTEESQKLGLYEDRPDWRITLQADHIKRLEEEIEQLKSNNELLEEKLKKIKNTLNDEVFSDMGKIQNIEWILER